MRFFNEKAVVLEMFGAASDGHFPGSPLELVESTDYPGYWFIVKDGEITRDLVSNEFVELFRFLEPIERAS